MQCAVADHLGETEVAVDAGREAHVDPDRAQLGRHEPTQRRRGFQRALLILVVEAAERAKRRQGEERLAEALHAPAFVVDGDEQRRRADRVQVGDEVLELLAA